MRRSLLLVASFVVVSFFASYPTGQKQCLVIALFIKTNNCTAPLIKHIRKERTHACIHYTLLEQWPRWKRPRKERICEMRLNDSN